MGWLKEGVREIARQIWLIRVKFGPRLRMRSDPSVAVVVLNYAREQNVDGILRSAGRCAFVQRIILSNNNPESQVRRFVEFDDPRLLIIDQDVRKRPGIRWTIARDQLRSSEIIICIDDDVFLFPGQIRKLVQHSLEDPQSVHGIAGALDGRYVSEIDAKVDYLVRVYCVRRAHVDRYFQLMERMHIWGGDVERVGDDIVISLAGEEPPMCHDLGPVLSCRTSLTEGIAVNQEQGFDEARIQILEEARHERSMIESEHR